ncbi:antitoxin of toxin-antitoxin stability system [Yoonia vestfoldensis]|uniref:Antitoxin of toxin-antitoxin stability system n=1 Tax=Yoonia vestfoldensis TaxID=245188 RepID=A0A1Y0E700_9RHOB|nr:antitoxin of toxin-antitoxin stability system [Yoonia vestfoldensis]ART99383.1 antitoxin of toxin-antitoxin stability system [Yoonia vestfoldensis]
MPEVICTTIYEFHELSDAAKEKARSWYRELGPHDDWWDAVYDDFECICDILGIRLKTTPVRLMGGGTRDKPRIWFSGFSYQGDGACMEGFYSHARGAAARIRAHAPKDKTLHCIADRMQAVQKRNFYQLAAEISHRGRYYHEYTMSVDVTRDGPTCQLPTEDAEEIVTEALRDLARWLYHQLETEYDYLTSDQAIEDSIIANQYSFTETGRRFG